MIDGLKIQMTSDELAARLGERANWNEAAARDYARRRRSRPEATEHRGRAATLRLLRDHLVPGEIYLLCERDLQVADLVPEFNWEMAVAPLYDEADVQ